MRQKKTEKIFYSILVVFFICLAFLSFVLITRLAFILHSKAVIERIDVGSGFVMQEVKGDGDSGLKGLKNKILSSYLNLLFPGSANLPGKINHPVVQLEKPKNNLAYSKPPDTFIRHATMIFTPHIMYAPVPGSKNFYSPHNLQQFRYNKDLKKKKQDEIRIFLTGGSTAWGCMAPDEKSTIASFLEKRLNESLDKRFFYRVINAAAGGWQTTDERIWIFNRITEFEPDMVISYSGYNDVFNVYLRKYNILNDLHNEGSYIFWGFKEYETYNRGPEMSAIMKYFPPLFYEEADFPRKTVKNVEIISSYLRYIDCPYVFVFQPVNRLGNSKDTLYLYDGLAKAISSVSKKAGFIFLNHIHMFDGKEHLFLDACHFGDIGNKIIADRLFKELQPKIAEIIKKRLKNT